MKNILVFNHHSLPFANSEAADNSVLQFLKVCIAASKIGLDTILVDYNVDPKWFLLELAPNYFWRDWYEKNASNSALIEFIRAFRSLATRQPLFLQHDEENEEFHLFEVYDDQKRIASPVIRAATWFDAPILSFQSFAPWNQASVTIYIFSLAKDGVSEARTSSELINIYSEACVNRIAPGLLALRESSYRSGKEVWGARLLLYPNVEFCGKTQSQLRAWSHSLACLDQVKESISVLNKFVAEWRAGTFLDYSHESLRIVGLQHRVSGESASCSDDPKRRSYREFYLNNGEKRYFENHIKIGGGFRIHFYCDSANKTVHVGYIGPHLP